MGPRAPRGDAAGRGGGKGAIPLEAGRRVAIPGEQPPKREGMGGEKKREVLAAARRGVGFLVKFVML